MMESLASLSVSQRNARTWCALNRAVELARGFEREAPRANAVIAIARGSVGREEEVKVSRRLLKPACEV